MKNKLFLFFIFFNTAFFCYAENENIQFGYSLGTGFNSGQTQEFVYSKKDYVLSRLDWKTFCSPLIQLSGNANIYHAIIDADFNIVIPTKCAVVEDWDWLESDHSRATNYSKSDVIINKDYQFDIKAGYEFLAGNFRILPEIGFKYRNKKYEANGGYYQYGSVDDRNDGYWSPELKKYSLHGTVMTYEQQYFMPYLSLDGEYTFCEHWTAKLYGSFIPYIKCDAIDFHCATVSKMYQYNDFMKNGMGFTVGAGIQYKNFSLSAEYEWSRCSSGRTTIRNIAYGTDFAEATSRPGIENSILTVKAIYKIK